MAKYLILSRFNDGDLSDLASRAQKVMGAINEQVPSIHKKWSCNLATMSGSFQVIDVIDSPSHADVMKAAALIEKHGRCRAEVLPVLDWDDFVAAVSAK